MVHGMRHGVDIFFMVSYEVMPMFLFYVVLNSVCVQCKSSCRMNIMLECVCV